MWGVGVALPGRCSGPPPIAQQNPWRRAPSRSRCRPVSCGCAPGRELPRRLRPPPSLRSRAGPAPLFRRGLPRCKLAATAPVDCLPCVDVPSTGEARGGQAWGGVVSNVNHLAPRQCACPPACGMSPAGPPLGRSWRREGARSAAFPPPSPLPRGSTRGCHLWPPPHRGRWRRALRAPMCAAGTSEPAATRPPFPSAWPVGVGGAGGFVVFGVGAPTRRRDPFPSRLLSTFRLLASPDKRARSGRLLVVGHLSRFACVRGRRGHRHGRRGRLPVELGRAPTGGCRLGHAARHPRARPEGLADAPPAVRSSSPPPPVALPPPVVHFIRGGGSRGPGPSACRGWCRGGGEALVVCAVGRRPTAVRAERARVPWPSPSLAGGGPVREPGGGRWGGGRGGCVVTVATCLCCARRGCRGRAGSVDGVARGVRSSLLPPGLCVVGFLRHAGWGGGGRGRRGHPFLSYRPVTRRWGRCGRRRGVSAGWGPVLARPPPPTFWSPLVAAAAATTAAVASIGVGGPRRNRTLAACHLAALPLLRPPPLGPKPRFCFHAAHAPPRGSPPHCLLSPPHRWARAPPAPSPPVRVARHEWGGVSPVPSLRRRARARARARAGQPQ